MRLSGGTNRTAEVHRPLPAPDNGRPRNRHGGQMNPRILLADDHRLMREGLRSIIEEDLHFGVIGQAADGREAVSLAQELHPDAVVMDIHMPVLNGIEATREILSTCENIKVIVLSMERDKKFVSRMFSAGAHAYVVKHAAFDELADAIRTVLTGRRYISRDVTDIVIDDYVDHLNAVSDHEEITLTAKERQVLQLLAEGHTTKEISSRLFVSVSTVETHRQHLYTKLNKRSIAGLTKTAIRMGLTEL